MTSFEEIEQLDDVINFIQNKKKYEKNYNQKIEILRTKSREDGTDKYLSLCINLSKMDNETLSKIGTPYSIIKYKEDVYAILKSINFQRFIDAIKFFDLEIKETFRNLKERFPEEFI